MNRLLHAYLSATVRAGALEVIDPAGRLHTFGDGSGPPVRIRFTTRRAEWAATLDPELRFGEAYMAGTVRVEAGTIYDFLDLVFASPAAPSRVAKLLDRVRKRLRRKRQNNGERRARRNVAHHYDVDGRIYDLFLDRDRQYSCAYFERADDDLETAQLAKKRHIAAKLALRPGHTVLDIGCGWGGLGLYLAEQAEARVTGVTLSAEQHRIASERAAAAGLAEQARFRLRDYRSVTERFDRIVSVGMFEHVGIGRYDEFFAKCRELLQPNGVMLLHAIGRSDGPGKTNPWVERYIFPGGYIPALSEVLPAIERQGLFVTDIEILRLHYAETLRAWRRRFVANWAKAAAIKGEVFCRMWEFYLAGAELAFRRQGMMVFQIQLVRDQTVLPLTRAYMADAESRLRLRDKYEQPLRMAGE